MKKILSYLLILVLVFSLAACGKTTNEIGDDLSQKDWDSILESAKGTTVNFYGWGGDQRINSWIDTYLGKRLKDEYDITLNRVPMNIDEILNKLLGEKQLNAEGTIDMVWINGENFFTAKENELLYGPFTSQLPSFQKYINADDIEVSYDFGFSVEGYEAPYGKAQFVITYDSAKLDKVPKNHKELLEMAKNNPGKFTYPAPPDFTGSAFVRNIIYDIVGHEQFMNMKADKETVAKAIGPAMDYFKEIKPYLWKKGKTYPATGSQIDNMFGDNEVIMTMSYHPNKVAGKIQTGEFPETSKNFVFENGTIGNTHFIAIPNNGQNKAGAMVAINTILSAEAQASKYDPQNWGDLPVLDNSKLNEEEKNMFKEIKIGEGVIPQDELLSHRVPEMPAHLIPIIEEIWLENIPTEGE